MKKIAAAMALVVALTFSVAYATTLAKDPVNKQCPIAKKDLKAGAPESEIKVKDKTYSVGFCCKNCKGKWDAEADPLKKWPVKEISQ